MVSISLFWEVRLIPKIGAYFFRNIKLNQFFSYLRNSCIELGDHLGKRTPEICESFKHLDVVKQKSMTDFVQRHEIEAWFQQKVFKPEQDPVQTPRYVEKIQNIAQ